MLNLVQRKLRVFAAAVLLLVLACVLTAGAQETKEEPGALQGTEKEAVKDEPDAAFLEIEKILAEEEKLLSEEWRGALFSEENVAAIKSAVRGQLPSDALEMREGKRLSLIRDRIRAILYGTIRQAAAKEAEKIVMAEIQKLPKDWQALALLEKNIAAVEGRITNGLTPEVVNLKKEKRTEALGGMVMEQLADLMHSVAAADAEKFFVEAFSTLPESWQKQVSDARKASLVEGVVKGVFEKIGINASREETGKRMKQEIAFALNSLAEKMAEDEIRLVVIKETSQMGTGLLDKIYFDGEALGRLLAEMKERLFKDAGAASASPASLYKAAKEKLPGITQSIFARERDKYRAACMKESLPEQTAFNPETYWLMFPLTEKISKEQETFPYVDEAYHICRAVADSDLSHCDKIQGEGREGHKEDCQSFARLYLKAFPELLEQGAYPAETMNEIFALRTSANAQKDAFEPLLKAFSEKNAAHCDALKGKQDDLYPVCVSAIKRDVKACSGLAFSAVCEQTALSFEALLYKDDSKLKSIPYENVLMPMALLSRLQFDKNTCADFYEQVIKKRFCFNLYMYKPAKEVKKDEKEKKQK